MTREEHIVHRTTRQVQKLSLDNTTKKESHKQSGQPKSKVYIIISLGREQLIS